MMAFLFLEQENSLHQKEKYKKIIYELSDYIVNFLISISTESL